MHKRITGKDVAMRTAISPLKRSRSGQAIVEFAFVAFVLTFLLGAMLALGFLFFSANVVQQAADVGAMELARHSEAPAIDFRTALTNSQLFDEQYLVCEIGGSDTAEEDLPANYSTADYTALQSRMPLINRMLLSVYIYDPDVNAIRYPGTLVNNVAGEATVLIPLVGFDNRNATTGVETISEWRRVVEEVIPAGEAYGPYSMSASIDEQGGLGQPGMVALRINYPYQSAGLVAYVHTDSDGNLLRPADTIGRDSVLNVPATADDSSVTGAASATFPNGDTLADAGYTLFNPTANAAIGASAHRGQYGFGKMGAFATAVRPYRKVLSSQAIYRREVFE